MELDTVEFVKTKGGQSLDTGQRVPEPSQRRSPAIISGRRSITLGDRCVVYRDVAAGQPIVTLLPFWSIDSFAVTTFRSNRMVVVALLCVLGSVVVWFDKPLLLANRMLLAWGYQFPFYQVITFLLFLFGVVAMMIYAMYPKPQLVIYNQSGKKKIRFVLPRHLDHVLEQFVSEVEAQMSRV